MSTTAVTEVSQDLFLVEVPLPNNVLRIINCYIIRGETRSLLIDTGFDLPVSEATICSALNVLGISHADLDFFITHQHSDHVGASHRIAAENAQIFCHSTPKGKSLLSPWDEEEQQRRMRNMMKDIAPVISGQNAVSPAPFDRAPYRWEPPVQGFTRVDEGDRLSYGPYSFRCVETPGHCDTHCCLYDEATGVFLSGDHVLQTISPNIADIDYKSRRLEKYLNSLEKVKNYPVSVVLPAHGACFQDLKARCEELADHHRDRLALILNLVESGYDTISQIAEHCRWNTDGVSWENLDPGIKFFAHAETLAHVSYLLSNGALVMSDNERFLIT